MVRWIDREGRQERIREEGRQKKQDKGKRSEKKKKRHEDTITIKAPSLTSCFHYRL
jgi:hypothetical protein